MYESFFGLAERPFTLRPDPTFLYLSPKHSLALSMLEYGLTGQTGFVVVTGEIGSGKTTIIRQFLKRADYRTTIGVISNTHVAFGDILLWVFQALDIKSDAADKAARYQAFINYLIKQYGAGYQVILIVDEAQNLTIDALEELRLLSNINTDKDQLVQIILVGQPELLANLKRPELKQFAQRISVHYHLSPLTYAESRAYIRHRLSVAGAKHEIFDTLAVGAIYYFSNGVPRLMNSICDMALVYAFAEGKSVIDIDIVLAVIRDREEGGIQALERTTADITRDALIDNVRKSFDQGEHPPIPDKIITQPTAQATPASRQMVNEVRVSAADQELHSAMYNNSAPIAPRVHVGSLSPAGPIAPFFAASYLPDDNQDQPNGMRQRKIGALRWIRWLI